MKNWLKILGLIALVAVIGFGVIACGNGSTSSPPPKPKVAVTGVTLNKTAIALFVGDDETLIATVAPSDASNKNVTWSSDDETVATVSDGTVTAVGEGEATITATAADGSGKTATCDVIVNPALNPDDITYTAVQVDGVSNTTTSTGIKFTFSESVTGLTAADITVGGVATKGALDGSGTEWILTITVSAEGDATVKITKAGIEATTKIVEVFMEYVITFPITLGDPSETGEADKLGWALEDYWDVFPDAKFFVVEVKGPGDNGYGFGTLTFALTGENDGWGWHQTLTGGWNGIDKSDANTITYIVVELSKLDGYAGFKTGTNGVIFISYSSNAADDLGFVNAYLSDKNLTKGGGSDVDLESSGTVIGFLTTEDLSL